MPERAAGVAGRVRGCIFACTKNSEAECLKKKLFGADKMHEDKVLDIRRGTRLFLYNIETSVLHGPFKAASGGRKEIVRDIWRGFYPYQVRVVSYDGPARRIQGFSKIEDILGLDWKSSMIDPKTTALITGLFYEKDKERMLETVMEYAKKNRSLLEKKYAKPPLESTTLWDYPTQSYGSTKKGSNKYAGVTPAYVIYNMVKRYTERGDLVVDPMAGSGTTLDVCKEEHRRCRAFDVAPSRPDIKQNDARKIPLRSDTADMVFIDSPYGDNIDYNDHPQNIGKLSAESGEFYEALDMVAKECARILRPDGVIGWLIGDQWVKKRFTPVGFKVYQLLERYLEPMDVIMVARRNQSSNTGIWHKRALRHNFYLRGHKYLLLFKKTGTRQEKKRRVSWKMYER